ncbi:MAG: cytochrome c [Pseudomonadota bacterium]
MAVSKLFLSAVLGVLVSGSVLAQAPTPEERAATAVDTRKSAVKLLRFSIVPMIGMARGMVPMDTEVVEKSAMRIAQVGAMLEDVFRMDTREFDIETEALDVIWEKPDDFSEKANDLITRANALAEIAATGDEDATKKAIGALGQGCGGCHDDFRED